ncbi:MAG: hypothetical protein U0S36_07775 [Candidatus Nanopelagicales bacterium]
MSIATVVLCPPLPGGAPAYDAAGTADVLLDDPRLAGVRVMSPDVAPGEPGDDERTARAHWVGQLAVALAVGGAGGPLLLVLDGSAGALAPALGFAQKAARRAVAGYVLVDAATPPVESRGGDWPDAPVWYLASPSADPLEVNQATLRGWTVVQLADALPAAVGDAIAGLAASV